MHDKNCACARSTASPRGVARVGGHRKVAIQPELNFSFLSKAVAVRKTPPTLPKEL